MKNFIIAALGVVCVILMFRSCGRQADAVTTKTDTVTVVRVDTVSSTNIVYRDRWRTRTDTIVHIEQGDTIYVPIPIDKYVFTDDTTYRAEVSGYNVTLDKMDVYRRTVTNNIMAERIILPKPKRWGIGIQVGYGVTTDGNLRPYIGIGISWNVVRF